MVQASQHLGAYLAGITGPDEPSPETTTLQTALVVSWSAGNRVINIKGYTPADVAYLASASGLVPGDCAAVLRYRTTFLVLGKVLTA